jgi:hypothetical protein
MIDISSITDESSDDLNMQHAHRGEAQVGLPQK